MLVLILLLTLSIFALGVFVGFRRQENNLRHREQRLAQERRHVNAQLDALLAHHDVNALIWQARDELLQAALLQARDIPFVVDYEIDIPAMSSLRNDTTPHTIQAKDGQRA